MALSLIWSNEPYPHEKTDVRSKVLLVEDCDVVGTLTHKVLSHDYEVTRVKNAFEAFNTITPLDPPDLILLDVVLPGLDGMGIARELKKNARLKHVPVIFLTSLNDTDSIVEGFSAGAVDFISKPIIAPVLHARVATHIRLKKQNDHLRSLSYADPLTGLANKRKYAERLEEEWARCTRFGTWLTMIAIDIDFFKQYNDHYGHAQGDACLAEFANLLRLSVQRRSDLVARTGGEEFTMILVDCDMAGARIVVERAFTQVAEANIAHAESMIASQVTFSAGVACMLPRPKSSSDQLYQMADAALYQAKSNGRSQACFDQVAD